MLVEWKVVKRTVYDKIGRPGILEKGLDIVFLGNCGIKLQNFFNLLSSAFFSSNPGPLIALRVGTAFMLVVIFYSSPL